MEDNIKSEPSGAAQNGAGAKKPGNKGRGGKDYKKYGKGGGRPRPTGGNAASPELAENKRGDSADIVKNGDRADSARRPKKNGGQPKNQDRPDNRNAKLRDNAQKNQNHGKPNNANNDRGRDGKPEYGKKQNDRRGGARNQKRGGRPQIHDGFDDIKMNPQYFVVDDYDDGEDTTKDVHAESAPVSTNPGVVAGRNAVRELLRSGRTVDKIYVKSGVREGSVVVIVAEAISRGIPVIEVDQHKLDRICGGENHQGVVAMAAEKDYVTLDDILDIARARGEAPLILIADGIEDPHNLGALIRCAECAGVHGIVIPKRRAVGLTPAVAKCSAGAIEHVPVAKVSSIPATIDALKREGVWIFAAEAGGTAYYDADFSLPAAIIFGSEGEGVGRLAREKSDFTVSIPMYGLVNSLNVSTAASVILCHAARVRHTMG